MQAAHPLYSVNGQLDASHLERLVLLFKHFEGINGLRDALLSDLAQTLFNQLTPGKIDLFANRHNLAPTHAEPWKNVFAFYGRARSNRIHACRKRKLVWTGCLVGKNLRTAQTRERVTLERAFRLFFAARSKGETRRAIGWRQRGGAPHISHGEHGCRAAHVSVFPKIR